MKKLLAFLVVSLFIHSTQSQVLNGKIYDGLSENGLRSVDIRVDGFTDDSTDRFGLFSLSLPGIERGASIRINLNKEGYSVINRESLRPRVPDKDSEQLEIRMCPSNQRNELAILFYDLKTRESIQRSYEAEAKILAGNMNYEAIAGLTIKKELAEKSVDSLAARLARFDPETSTKELAYAIKLSQEGKAIDALDLLDPDKIVDRITDKRGKIEELENSIEQEIESLISAADIAITIFQFDKAQNYYEKAVEADPANYGNYLTLCTFLFDQTQSRILLDHARKMIEIAKDEIEKSTALIYLGNASVGQNRYTEAIDSFQEALRIYRKLTKENPQKYESDVALTLNNLGNVYTNLNRYTGEAIASFQEALRIYRKLAKENPQKYESDVASTLNNQGLAYVDLNRYTEAVDSYQEALGIRRKLAKENPQKYESHVAGTLNNLGNAYTDLNRYTEAVDSYQEALGIFRKLVKKNPQKYESDVARTLNILGNSYAALNRYTEAIDFYQEALGTCRKLAKENPQKYESDVANTLNNLGIAYADLNRYTEAVDSYQEALGISRKLAKENPQKYESHVANTLNNQGIAYADLNRYTEAIDFYQEALGIRRKLAKENPQKYESDVALTHNNLGVAFKNLSRYTEAVDSYQEALGIYRKLAKENPQKYESYVAMTLNNLGIAYADLNRYTEAVDSYQEALGIFRKLAKENPSVFGTGLGNSLYNLGLVYSNILQLTEALSYFQQADSAYSLSKGSLSSQKWQQHSRNRIIELSRVDALGKALDNKGWQYYRQSQADSARKYFLAAMEEYKAIPEDSLDIQAHYNLSFLFEHLTYGEVDQKKTYLYYQQAVNHRQKVANTYPENIDILSRLASAYYNLSWYSLFTNSFKESESAARKTLELSPESTGVISNLASALLLQGKYLEAKSLYEEWKDKAWVDDRYQTFKEVFLSDLKELEEAGIKHPDVDRIRILLSTN
ncbi:MAG: DUF3856 domain-containing protein [Bacteroidota bacterium]